MLQGSGKDYGAWTLPGTLRVPKLVPGTYNAKLIRPSRDRWEHPVITWVEHNAGRGFLGTVLLSIPDRDGRFTDNQNLPGTDDALFAESVRDSLGDVWLVWRSSDNGMFWTHSHVRATATNVRLVDRGRRRTLAFALDERAPDSWWTILRARDDDPFEAAGRVQAGDGLELTWTDDSPPRGRLRYKVRRDCLDARYQWESDEVAWPRGAARRPGDPGAAGAAAKRATPELRLPARPLGQGSQIEVSGAVPGELELALFDLQGRRVYSRRAVATSEGAVRFTLDSAPAGLISGVYFARVRDAGGDWTRATRVVVLR